MPAAPAIATPDDWSLAVTTTLPREATVTGVAAALLPSAPEMSACVRVFCEMTEADPPIATPPDAATPTAITSTLSPAAAVTLTSPAAVTVVWCVASPRIVALVPPFSTGTATAGASDTNKLPAAPTETATSR